MRKTFVRLWNIIREHRTAFLAGSIVPALLGLVLGESVMAVQFNVLQPILGGMTLLTVEIFGAFLVDFPLSMAAGCIISRKMGMPQAKYGAVAGAVFLTVFILLVASMGAFLGYFTTALDVFELRSAVLLAAQTAGQALGWRLGVIMFMFLVADYFLCMLGGILGFSMMRLLYGSEAEEPGAIKKDEGIL